MVAVARRWPAWRMARVAPPWPAQVAATAPAARPLAAAAASAAVRAEPPGDTALTLRRSTPTSPDGQSPGPATWWLWRGGQDGRCGLTDLPAACSSRPPRSRRASSAAVSCCCCTTTTKAPRAWSSTGRWRPTSTRCCRTGRRTPRPRPCCSRAARSASTARWAWSPCPATSRSRSGSSASSAALGLVDLDTPPALVVPEVAGLRIFAGYAGWSRRAARGRGRGRGAGTSSEAEGRDAFDAEPDELWTPGAAAPARPPRVRRDVPGRPRDELTAHGEVPLVARIHSGA